MNQTRRAGENLVMSRIYLHFLTDNSLKHRNGQKRQHCFFFKMVLNTGSYSQEHPNVSDYRTIQKSYFHKKDLLSELKKLMRNVISPVTNTKFIFSVHVLQKLMKAHCYFFN